MSSKALSSSFEELQLATMVQRDEELVTLVAKDGIKFQVKTCLLRHSRLLHALIQEGKGQRWIENKPLTIPLTRFRAIVVQRIIDYLNYKERYTLVQLRQSNTKAMDEFVVEPELLTELIEAADYLDL